MAFEKSHSPELENGNNDTECAQGTHFTIQHNGDKVEATTLENPVASLSQNTSVVHKTHYKQNFVRSR
jgi:hypothetical protein